MRLLLCVPILCELGEEDRLALFRSLKLLSYKPGQLVCAENMATTHFYIIKEGRVEVRCSSPKAPELAAAVKAMEAKVARSTAAAPTATADHAAGAGEGEAGGSSSSSSENSSSAASSGSGSGPGEEGSAASGGAGAFVPASAGELVGVLGPGQWFGEEEVRTGASCPFTFLATEPTQCFVLDGETFKLYLVPLMLNWAGGGRPGSRGTSVQGLSEGGLEDEGGSGGAAAAPMAGGGGASGSPAAAAAAAAAAGKPRRERLGIPFRELELRTTLGTGTFGRVRIVYHRRSNRVFALKMLQKTQVRYCVCVCVCVYVCVCVCVVGAQFFPFLSLFARRWPIPLPPLRSFFSFFFLTHPAQQPLSRAPSDCGVQAAGEHYK